MKNLIRLEYNYRQNVVGRFNISLPNTFILLSNMNFLMEFFEHHYFTKHINLVIYAAVILLSYFKSS